MLRELIEKEVSVARYAACASGSSQSTGLLRGPRTDAPGTSTGTERTGGRPEKPPRDVPPGPPV